MILFLGFNPASLTIYIFLALKFSIVNMILLINLMDLIT